MAQFTVYRNAENHALYPLLLDVQSPLLDTLDTRLVIPLTPLSRYSGPAMSTLTPVLDVEQQAYLMLTPQMAGIPRKALGATVADLSERRDDIIAAIDFLVTGI